MTQQWRIPQTISALNGKRRSPSICLCLIDFTDRSCHAYTWAFTSNTCARHRRGGNSCRRQSLHKVGDRCCDVRHRRRGRRDRHNSIYGLSGEVSSADTERAPRVAQRMRTGSVTVNGSTFFGIARWAAPNRADWADATASRASRNTSKSRPSACPPDEVLRYFGEGVTECLSGWSKALFAQMGEQDSAGWSALEWDKTDVVAQI